MAFSVSGFRKNLGKTTQVKVLIKYDCIELTIKITLYLFHGYLLEAQKITFCSSIYSCLVFNSLLV